MQIYTAKQYSQRAGHFLLGAFHTRTLGSDSEVQERFDSPQKILEKKGPKSASGGLGSSLDAVGVRKLILDIGRLIVMR